MTTKVNPLTYFYRFHDDEHRVKLEARFWNQGGKQLAIIASVTKGVDWAAYIGTDAPDSNTEDATLQHVAKWGCKLSENDARHFFPNMELPYRS